MTVYPYILFNFNSVGKKKETEADDSPAASRGKQKSKKIVDGKYND